MNVYEDYYNYIEEHKELLNNLKSSSSQIMIAMDDVLLVMNYLYNKQKDGAKLSLDEEEIFDIGFTYLTIVIDDLTIYYNDYFKKDIIKFNQYAILMFFSVYAEDLKGFLIGEEIYEGETKKDLEAILTEIDSAIANEKVITDDLTKKIESIIEESTPSNGKFKPVYEVFNLIGEELDLY